MYKSAFLCLCFCVIASWTLPIFSHHSFSTLIARASSPAQSGNIEDLRTHGNLAQSSNLRAHSYTNSRIQTIERQGTENIDDTSITDAEEEPQNEAVPSLVSKKINKILQKIQLISSLSGGFLQGSNGENDGDTNYPEDIDDNVGSSATNTTIFTSSATNISFSSSNVSESVVTTSTEGALRITLGLDPERRSNDMFDKLEDFGEEVEMVPNSNRKDTMSAARPQVSGSSGSNNHQFLPFALAASLMQTFGNIMGQAYRSLIYFSQPNNKDI